MMADHGLYSFLMMYKVVYTFFYALSKLPFRVLYGISDAEYLIMYYLLRYRRGIVRKNLMTSFPEKSTLEIVSIEKAFYHWFCDYFFETLKMLSMSKEEMAGHIEFRQVEDVEKCFDEGQDCAAILGHYCNWEYLSATGIAFDQHPDAVMGLIYHPLYNKVFDRLFIDMRQSMGGVCIPKQKILRYLVSYRQQDRRSLFGYIADQGPKWENIHLWLPFMHHETPVFTGAERIMRKMHDAVFYVDMERPERGHYICTFRLITREPEQMEEYGITKAFFKMLEQTIRRDPRYYLWSHHRWKRTHEEFDRRFQVVNGKVVPKSHAENTD